MSLFLFTYAFCFILLLDGTAEAIGRGSIRSGPTPSPTNSASTDDFMTDNIVMDRVSVETYAGKSSFKVIIDDGKTITIKAENLDAQYCEYMRGHERGGKAPKVEVCLVGNNTPFSKELFKQVSEKDWFAQKNVSSFLRTQMAMKLPKINIQCFDGDSNVKSRITHLKGSENQILFTLSCKLESKKKKGKKEQNEVKSEMNKILAYLEKDFMDKENLAKDLTKASSEECSKDLNTPACLKTFNTWMKISSGEHVFGNVAPTHYCGSQVDYASSLDVAPIVQALVSGPSNDSEINQKDENNLNQGFWKTYYKDGTVESEGYYKDGKQEGQWKYYHDNGRLSAEKNYKSGKLDGTNRTYGENGELESDGHYKDGREDGSWIYYKNGQFFFDEHYKDGVPIDLID